MLKACIIAGEWSVLSVLVYDKYRPCSADLCAILDCARTVRLATNWQYDVLSIRPRFPDDVEDAHLITFQPLKESLHRNKSYIDLIRDNSEPFLYVFLELSPRKLSGSISHLAHLVVDMLSLQHARAVVICSGRPQEQPERNMAKTGTAMECNVRGVSYAQARAIGKVIDVALAFDTDLAAVNYSVYTRSPLTRAQAKSFLRIMHRNMLRTSHMFRPKESGIVTIIDGSQGLPDMRGGPSTAMSASLFYELRGSGKTSKLAAVRLLGFLGAHDVERQRLRVLDDDEASSEESAAEDELAALGIS